MKEREWQVMADDRHLGVFTESQLTQRAAEATLPPGALLSHGEGWITLPQFMAERGIRAAVGVKAASPAAPPPVVRPPAVPPPPVPPPPVDVVQKPPVPPPVEPDASTTATESDSPPQPQQEPEKEDHSDDGGPPERDRIVVLGRRQSGKTIYLAGLYSKLWRSLDGLTAKALRGEVHQQLTEVNHVLRRGEWPAATLETRQMELELEEGGRKRLMVALDYAGEIFARAFVEERVEIPMVKTLLDHIDRAAAVIMLVDPSIIAGTNHQAATEDDFGLVQAVQRIRNWPRGEDVPIVLVLTKVDEYQALLDRFGGPDGFVRHHFPALVRLLKAIPIFQVSAVQVDRRADGKRVPRKDSSPVNVDKPLRYCLNKILKAELKAEAEQQEADRLAMIARAEQERVRREKKQSLILIISVAAVLLAGVAVSIWILMQGK